MSRALRGLLTLLLGLVGFVGAGPSPAAAEGEMGLSPDGRTWSDRLPGPLFDPSVRWVPGDVRTSTFFVRNQAPDGASLRVEVRTDAGDRRRRDGALTLEARFGGDRWVPFDGIADAHVWFSETLASGDEVRLRVRATLDRAATNTSQRAGLGLRFRVVLEDARAAQNGASEGGTVEDGATPSDDSGLPGTGAPRFAWVLLLAAILLGAGTTVLRGRREVIRRG